MPCVLSTANFKCAFPTFSLDKRGKNCMVDTWRSTLPEFGRTDIIVYNTHSNNRYFKYGNFITPNNLFHSAVLETFLEATRLVQQCVGSEQHPFEVGGDNVEITIVVQCISPNDPKISYYIADHANRIVRWIHNNVPKCYNTDADARMRDCAEYWHHRSKFPVHRHCTPEDRAEVAELLNGMLTSVQGDASVDPEEVGNYIRKLENIPPSSPLTDHQTSVLAEIHSEALKHSLPAFYSPSLSIKGILFKSLLGLSMPKFAHNLTHKNPGTAVTQVIREHLRTNTRRPHSSVHTGGTPHSPSRST